MTGIAELMRAIEMNDVEQARRLITSSVDVNELDPETGLRPLILAVDVQCDGFIQKSIPVRLTMIRLLLASGADALLAVPDGTTALSLARSYSVQEVFEVLNGTVE